MADIFISYAREDREWVEKLATQLVTEGFTVWWDWDLLVGKRYRETIETELQTARATWWSGRSIPSVRTSCATKPKMPSSATSLLPLVLKGNRSAAGGLPPAADGGPQQLEWWRGTHRIPADDAGRFAPRRRAPRRRTIPATSMSIRSDHPTTHFDPPCDACNSAGLMSRTDSAGGVPQPDWPPVTVARRRRRADGHATRSQIPPPSPAVAPVPSPHQVGAPTPAPAARAEGVNTHAGRSPGGRAPGSSRTR